MLRRLLPMIALIACSGVAQARDVAGEVSYLPRIALPADALVIVELRGTTGVVAEARILPDGKQVPIPFVVVAPDNGDFTLRSAIFVGGRAEWVSDTIPVPGGEGVADLGVVTVSMRAGLGLWTKMDCGGTAVEVGFAESVANLRVGGEVFALQEVAAASGAKYSDNASPETMVWSKGSSAMVTVKGVDLAECRPMIDVPLLPMAARGNEPFWSLDVTETGFVYLGNLGATKVQGPLPQAVATAKGVRFDAPDGFGFAVERRLCHDTMSGMPFPLSVSVSAEGKDLQGCGGVSADLLSGKWTVEQVEGAVLPRGSEVSLEFDTTASRVSGQGGCNRFNGGFDLTGEGLSFGPAAATMMACPQDLMAIEAVFLKALETIDRFDLVDGALELYAGGTVVLRARR
jgi:heat shock protein HslJ/uncharacterized lipoprotein YbaY